MWKWCCKLLEDIFGMLCRKLFFVEVILESKCIDERLYVISCIDLVIICEFCVNLFSVWKEWFNGEIFLVIRGFLNIIMWYMEFYVGKFLGFFCEIIY